MNEDAKEAIEKRRAEEQQQSRSLAKVVEEKATALISAERAKQFVAIINLMAIDNPKLAQCTVNSKLTALMACVHLDLLPNTPEAYAYIIPYGNTATFQLGYRGLIELAYRSGVVKSINAELVFPKDKFRVRLGTERALEHEPSTTVENRSDWSSAIKVYATAKLNNGEVVFEIMDKGTVEKIHKGSKAGSSGPWKDWPDMMAKKTVLKRLLKYLPSSAKDNRFKLGVEYDSWAEAGKLALGERNQIIEGETETKDQPPKTIRNYGKSQVTFEQQNEMLDDSLGVSDESKTTEEDESMKQSGDFIKDLSDDDLLENINASFGYLKLPSADKTRLIRQYTNKVILKNIERNKLEGLARYLDAEVSKRAEDLETGRLQKSEKPKEPDISNVRTVFPDAKLEEMGED